MDLNGSGITSRAAIIASTASCLPAKEWQISGMFHFVIFFTTMSRIVEYET
jgi:hypothetical protein